jgi:hypothetical protein
MPGLWFCHGGADCAEGPTEPAYAHRRPRSEVCPAFSALPSSGRSHQGIVKDQYFGDARDYFKYHLLMELVTRVPGVEKLVCLWMLTAPDESGEGNVAFAQSGELQELNDFLRLHLEAGDRRVHHLREFFQEQGIRYTPWGDEPPYFTTLGREEYFASVPDEYLRDSVVFFDPDIGLTSARPTPKHLALRELASTVARMNRESLAVIYQHRWRRIDFWNTMALQIERVLKQPIRFVADPAVAFFVSPKDGNKLTVIEDVLKDVAASARSRSVGP